MAKNLFFFLSLLISGHVCLLNAWKYSAENDDSGSGINLFSDVDDDEFEHDGYRIKASDDENDNESITNVGVEFGDDYEDENDELAEEDENDEFANEDDDENDEFADEDDDENDEFADEDEDENENDSDDQIGDYTAQQTGKQSGYKSSKTSGTDTRVPGDIEKVVQQIIETSHATADIKQLLKVLYNLTDISWPPLIANRKSHEVGQFLLIVNNAVNDLLYQRTLEHRPPTRAIERTFEDSMGNYTQSYVNKLIDAIKMVYVARFALYEVDKLSTKLKATDNKNEQLRVILKFYKDKGDGTEKHFALQKIVSDAVKNYKKTFKSNIDNHLVQNGAGRFVMLNTPRTAELVKEVVSIILTSWKVMGLAPANGL